MVHIGLADLPKFSKPHLSYVRIKVARFVEQYDRVLVYLMGVPLHADHIRYR